MFVAKRNIVAFALLAGLTATSAAALDVAPSPEPRPQPPHPLKAPDSVMYKEIFTLQDSANWERADKVIKQLDNTILMGHVLSQRYLHPTKYRARWTELRDWLKNYADQPGAWQIYKLAIKRKPRGIAVPKQPPERIYHNERASSVPALFTTRAKRRIKYHVYDLVQRERPTQALRYINQRGNRNRLTYDERNFLKSLISRSYYIERKVEKSLEVAKVAAASRRSAPLADWHAGLASYRLGNMEQALAYFKNLAYNSVASSTLRARGAFWAGRSLRRMERILEAENYFRQAANSGVHFYSLLALQYIDSELNIEWQNRAAPIDEIFLTHPALRRAELLRAADREPLAERELFYLQERVSEGEARALLTYLDEQNYPAVQLAVSTRLDRAARNISRNAVLNSGGGNEKQAPYVLGVGSFPAPDLAGIDQVDRALLFALIRQESRFRETARSSAGARGLMQLMPRTAAFISGNRNLARREGREQLLDAELNIALGQQYLTMLMQEKYFEDNLVLALAAYNAGPGSLRRWQRELEGVTDPLLFIESLPAVETRKYIHSVMTNLWVYRHRFGQETSSRRLLAAETWPPHKRQDKQGSKQTSFTPAKVIKVGN